MFKGVCVYVSVKVSMCKSVHPYVSLCLCMCVCVRERERRVLCAGVSEYVCERERAQGS